MKLTTKKLLTIAVTAALCAPMASWATVGYFAHGYGIKAKGMGGAGVAFSQDALAAATNPAGMVLVGSRMDFGIELFRPEREAQSSFGSSPVGGSSWYDGDETTNFLIPEFGYNRMLNKTMSVGISVYGNGGMNSDYDAGIYSSNPMNPASKGEGTGVDLAQLFIAPTFAMKINEKHSFGISLNLAYQTFEATGLSDFCGFTPGGNPAGCADGVEGLSDQGKDSSTGYGLRIGWVGEFSDMVSVGVTYQTRTQMGEFDKYDQLFAEQGDFDIPANYAIGIKVQALPTTVIAFDVERILYGDVKAIANDNNGWTGGILGTDNGPGFGWDDMTIFKLGVQHQFDKNLVVRAGFVMGDQPISEGETQFNVLAPAVIEKHLTLGATMILSNGAELSGYYMHAFEETVKGDSPGNPADAGHGNIRMSQNAIGIAYGWKL
ncbi:MAG: outer membrane protein transport protein [Ectothiorhodospiraceae bacterium]|nr:outer membrane protein transport protein [Ectothiorhodospiraceae bacterium]